MSIYRYESENWRILAVLRCKSARRQDWYLEGVLLLVARATARLADRVALWV